MLAQCESRTPHTPAHPVLTSQNRVLLAPDDGLAEIQLVFLPERRVVGTVSIAPPDVEPTLGLRHSRGIAELRIQQAIEFLTGHDSESAGRAGAVRR